MTTGKQTSDRLSSLAAFILTLDNEEISDHATLHPEDIRSLAASVLSQDETKGKKENDGQHYPVSE